MRSISVRHGGLVLALLSWGGIIARAAEPLVVRSRTFDVHYAINDDAQPLDSLHLWYTLDGGQTWQDFGEDADRQSPIPFQAPREGLYGFFVVARNATGPSSTPPKPGTKPQMQAFVDATPPVVQLHALRQTVHLGHRVLQIRWTAIDSQFSARPIEIAYQRLPDDSWHQVTPEPMANTGQFDWSLPESLSGSVRVRVIATDQGGHRVPSEAQGIDLTDVEPRPLPASLTRPAAGGAADVAALPLSSRAQSRAEQLFAEAIARRDRGEYREAVARLREAVRLNPQWAEAFVEMADLLYHIGDLDRALSAYQLALRHRPKMREALRGAARVYRRKSDPASAARALRTILRNNPNDAEVWMNLGDVAVYQGDELLARYCYTRATRTDPSAVDVIAEARKRLDLMATAKPVNPPGNR